MTETPCILPLTRRQLLHDLILAVGLAALACLHLMLLPELFESGQLTSVNGLRVVGTPPQADPLAIPLLLLAFLPLAVRRLWPLMVLAVAVAASLAMNLLLPSVSNAASLAPLIAIYTVGTLYPRRTLLAVAAVVGLLSAATASVGAPAERLVPTLIQPIAVTAMAASIGDATRSRRAYIAAVELRALEAERTREEEALRRVEEERLRVARELHDVTGHALAIIAVQAGGAQRVLDRDPDAVRHALEAIRTTSRDALDELRAMLGVLRGADDGVPLAPMGRLSRLTELAATIESAGISTTVEIEGTLDDLPAYVDLSAYRIIQEALTNIVRHAGASSATVVLVRADDSLSIEVRDNGAGPGPDSLAPAGHGLTGMRERVTALRGTFVAGMMPGGGYRVAATLPFGKER